MGDRSLIDLYNVLYKYIEDTGIKSSWDVDGLCNKILELYLNDLITSREHEIILRNFYKNKPNNDLHFNYFVKDSYVYWFENDGSHDELRKDFVKHLINNHIK